MTGESFSGGVILTYDTVIISLGSKGMVFANEEVKM